MAKKSPARKKTTRNKEDKFFIVCNPANHHAQSRYLKHATFGSAVGEARRLAQVNKGNKFLVFEPVGGFVCVEDGVMEEVQLVEGVSR